MSSEDGKREPRIFHVETRFQKLARRTGAVSREKAVEMASANLDEIKPGFDDWLDAELENLNNTIKRGQTGAPDLTWVESANIYSRQLRDVGTTMGYELLTYIANSLCEVLDAIEGGAELNIETVTCHLDAIFLARQQPYRNMRPDQVPELINGLRRVANSIISSPT